VLLGWYQVNDKGITQLKRALTALTSLNLDDCPKVTIRGLRSLAPLTGLTSLDLAGCIHSDAGVSVTARFPIYNRDHKYVITSM
jgi:hypothetical protein